MVLLPSKRRTSQPTGYLEFASLTGCELVSPALMHQMFPNTLLDLKGISGMATDWQS